MIVHSPQCPSDATQKSAAGARETKLEYESNPVIVRKITGVTWACIKNRRKNGERRGSWNSVQLREAFFIERGLRRPFPFPGSVRGRICIRGTAKHNGITRTQPRDVKSCDTLSRHGRETTIWSLIELLSGRTPPFSLVFSSINGGYCLETSGRDTRVSITTSFHLDFVSLGDPH